jgi:hypothetical protein
MGAYETGASGDENTTTAQHLFDPSFELTCNDHTELTCKELTCKD